MCHSQVEYLLQVGQTLLSVWASEVGGGKAAPTTASALAGLLGKTSLSKTAMIDMCLILFKMGERDAPARPRKSLMKEYLQKTSTYLRSFLKMVRAVNDDSDGDIEAIAEAISGEAGAAFKKKDKRAVDFLPDFQILKDLLKLKGLGTVEAVRCLFMLFRAHWAATGCTMAANKCEGEIADLVASKTWSERMNAVMFYETLFADIGMRTNHSSLLTVTSYPPVNRTTISITHL
jgi:hypothetical protein